MKQLKKYNQLETTASIVTETFEAEEKIIPMKYLINNMNLQQVF